MFEGLMLSTSEVVDEIQAEVRYANRRNSVP